MVIPTTGSDIPKWSEIFGSGVDLTGAKIVGSRNYVIENKCRRNVHLRACHYIDENKGGGTVGGEAANGPSTFLMFLAAHAIALSPTKAAEKAAGTLHPRSPEGIYISSRGQRPRKESHQPNPTPKGSNLRSITPNCAPRPEVVRCLQGRETYVTLSGGVAPGY